MFISRSFALSTRAIGFLLFTAVAVGCSGGGSDGGGGSSGGGGGGSSSGGGSSGGGTLAPLQGAYRTTDAAAQLTFFKSGDYVLGNRNDDPSCNQGAGTDGKNTNNGNGVEVGKYSWNSTTLDFKILSTSVHTNGDCTLSKNGAASDAGEFTLKKNSDGSLTLTPKGEAGVTLVPVPSNTSTLIGSFQINGATGTGVALAEAAPTIISFIDATHYFLVGTKDAPATGDISGIEIGCYSVDPGTNRLTINLTASCAAPTGARFSTPIDTNGDNGFSNVSASATLVANSANTLRFQDGTITVDATRIPTE